jgi:TolA-binding protein
MQGVLSMAFDPSTIAVALIMALAQLGSVKLLVGRSLKDIDSTKEATNAHAVLLERTAQVQKSTAETLQKVQDSIEELYDARNSTKDNLTEINTLHKIKKCADHVGGDQTLYQGSKGKQP